MQESRTSPVLLQRSNAIDQVGLPGSDTVGVTLTHAPGQMTEALPHLLLVDDDPVMIRVLAKMLDGVGELRFALSGRDALRVARERVPDLILLDAELGDSSGFAICAELKSEPRFHDVPIIFVTSHSTQASELEGFAAGAADFIAKPVSEPLLRARVGTHLRMQRLTSELRRLSNTDALTRIANRHMFDQMLSAEWHRASRGAPLALLMVDVDHFKEFNDGYGHPAGDACLQAIASALSASCRRAGDVVARVGGEEFGLLLPATTLDGATSVARRARHVVRSLNIPHARSSCASVVTISIGIAWYPESLPAVVRTHEPSERANEEARRPEEVHLLKAADEALYGAKRAGRDRAWMIDMSDANSSAIPLPWVDGVGESEQSRTTDSNDSRAA